MSKTRVALPPTQSIDASSVAAFERHYSPQELAELWGFDQTTIRRMFIDEPGVLKMGKSARKDGKRDYLSLRIPRLRRAVGSREEDAMSRKTPKPAASINQIAEVEGLSATAIRKVINSGLRKLRGQPEVITARELCIELDRNRATENSVRRPGRR